MSRIEYLSERTHQTLRSYKASRFHGSPGQRKHRGQSMAPFLIRAAMSLLLPAVTAVAACAPDSPPPATVQATRPTQTDAAQVPDPNSVATAEASPATDSQGYGPNDESSEAKPRGVLRIAQARDPTSCDLPMAQATSYQSVHPCNPMLSQIVRISTDDHSAVIPDLALSWETSSDGAEWKFTLRPDATWHNGRPVSADDLKFSLDRVITPPEGLTIGRAGVIARYVPSTDMVSTPDTATLLVQTDFPAASFLPNLASVYVSIYPRAETEELSPPSMMQFSTVIGSGPFTPGPATRGAVYSLQRNPQYYEPGLPMLNEVRFLVMPHPATRMAALQTRVIDTIAIVTEPEAMVLEQDFAGEVNVYRSPSAGGNTVQLNLSRPPFNDPIVRRAVALAFSRADADLALGPGYDGAILPPGGPWGLSEEELLKLEGYGDKNAERDQARKLLAQAGYPDGMETSIKTQATPFFQTLAEFAAGQLSTVGIRAEVTTVEPVEYQRIIRSGEFEIIAHSHSFPLDDPDSILIDHYSCDGNENFPGLCDPELDRMINRQSRTLDAAQRKTILDDIQRSIWHANAKIWFQWSSRRTPVLSNVHAMEPGGSSLYQGRRLERVWID